MGKILFKRQKKVNKGAPSGLVISLIFHAAVFFIAGLFVVFTVVNKPEPEFTPPPPVERPKMKLKKPKVKVKKSSQPKPSSRIVAKVKTREMPEIQLPDLMGTGEGLMGGTGLGGEFMDLPAIPEVSQLGSTTSIGSDLTGTFYDFKRNRNGKWITDWYETYDYLRIVNKFIEADWNPFIISKYYRSPKKLYATCVVVPPTYSAVAPSAFDSIDSTGGYWMVHYKGQLVHKDGITFRFVCSSDYFIVIRVDGKIVWAGVWNPPVRYQDYLTLVGSRYSMHSDTRRYFYGNDRGMAGDWITLEPGVPKDIEIIIGDEDGKCGFIVAVEEKDQEYETGPQGNPIFPVFRTAVLSHDLIDQIYKDLAPGEVCLTNGPVFCDYDTTASGMEPSAGTESPPAAEEPAEDELRTWSFKNGQTLEATYIRDLFDKIQLKDAQGEEYSLPRETFDLSAADQEYLELENPPKMKLKFIKSIQRKNFPIRGKEQRPPEQRASFGAEVEQTGTKAYNHPLLLEFYAIGKQIKGDRYILLDRQSSPFSLTKENKFTFELASKRIVRLTYLWADDSRFSERGEEYYGFVVVVKDKRGKVIAINASNDWLAEHLANLEKLSVHNYMDKTCTRTYPSRPQSYIAAEALDRL